MDESEMGYEIVSIASRQAAPWKNGRGLTTELAAHPEGATLGSFAWRISIADMHADAPFSEFPGIDRTLVLIEGAGIDLTIDGTSHRLDGAGPILAFDGGDTATARLVAGAARDFNVMTRRGVCHHTVRLLPAGAFIRPVANRWFVLAGFSACTVSIDGRTHRLDRYDLLSVEGGRMAFQVDCPALLVEVFAAG